MLYAKYRPKSWPELIGQDKAVGAARRIIGAESFDRGAFWIEAAGEHNSGIGKTSLALLIAAELQPDRFYVLQLAGRDLDLSAVREIDRSGWLSTPNGRGRVWVIDEAHSITQGAVDALLPLLENLPPRCCLIFTTTRAVDAGLFGDDCGPFASRTFRLKLTNQGIAEPLAARLLQIVEAESLINGQPGQRLGRCLRLIRAVNNNMRAALQRAESGELL